MAELVSGQEGLAVGNRHGDYDPLSHIKLQLTVTLFRLGTKSISIKKVAWIFGVSRGLVHVYTWRCIYAIDQLAEQFIDWPDQAQRAEISRWFKTEKGFPSCIGAVDGVACRSNLTWVQNTKSMPGSLVNTRLPWVQLQLDHLGRFTYASTGYIGSVHDSTAFKNPSLHRDKDRFFQGKEYLFLLADAAYALRLTDISRYKNSTGDQLWFNHIHGVAPVASL